MTRRPLWHILLGAALAAAVPAAHAQDGVIDSIMCTDPDPPAARAVTVFPDRLLGLWLEALGRPEADLRCRAALAIAAAHQRGMKGLTAAVPQLVAILDQPELQPAVRLAAAQALVALDSREAAPALLRQARAGDGVLRGVVEPALARWDHRPARPVWLARIAGPAAAGRDLLLAVEGVATVREEAAVPGLRGLVIGGGTPPSVRLAAARALGTLRTAGSEADARTCAGGAEAVHRLAAAELLRHHAGDGAVAILRGLAGDAEPAVAAVALARLIEIDPKLVVPESDRLLACPDARLRALAVDALVLSPSGDHARLLADRLDDPHPAVRVAARRGLRLLSARPEFRDTVARQGLRVLAAPGWRGREQAAVLLAQVGHQPAAGQLVGLLPSGRPEVAVAAAWAVRQLGVADTLPAASDFFRSPRWDTPLPADAADRQLSQLAQFLGAARFAPADAALRRLVPRAEGASVAALEHPFAGPEARAAAVWALGRLHAGQPVPDLVHAFRDRLRDVDAAQRTDEDHRVRRMAAVALGRMKARDALGALRSSWSGKPTLDPVNNACGWAIAQITGERLPPDATVENLARDWFLLPLVR